MIPCQDRRSLSKEASYNRCLNRFPKGVPGPRMQADEVATIDFVIFSLQLSSQTCPVFPTQMFLGPESLGAGRGSVGKEPQGHDAEHGLLTHTTVQGLDGFFQDECLEEPGKVRIYLREVTSPPFYNCHLQPGVTNQELCSFSPQFSLLEGF